MNAAGLGLAASVGGTLVNGLTGSAGSGSQQDVLAYNEQVARQNAQQSRDAALQDELASRRQASQAQGTLRAAVAESGVDPNAGSALLVQQDSARNGELDALQRRYQGTIRGVAYDNQAQQFAYQREAVEGNRRSGLFGTGLSLASQLLGGYASGAFGGGGAGLSGILSGGTSAGVKAASSVSGGVASNGAGLFGAWGAETAVGGGNSGWTRLAQAVIGNESSGISGIGRKISSFWDF